MSARFDNSERGAISGYLISLVLLAVVLVGGVVLLKNNKTTEVAQPNESTSKPQSSESASSNNQQTAETKPSNTESNSESTKTEETEGSKSTTTNNDNGSVGNPETITATGPEDFFGVLMGFAFVAGAVYAAWNYRLSRSAIKNALLNR